MNYIYDVGEHNDNENWMIECVLEELKKNSGRLLVGMSGFWS